MCAGNFTLPGHLSSGSRSLLLQMLMVDPSRRIQLQDIKRHPWFEEKLPAYLRTLRPAAACGGPPDALVLNQMAKVFTLNPKP